MLHDGSPELRLVAAATGTHTETGGATIESLVSSVTDWDAVFDIADAHAAQPHLYRHLTAPGISVPESVHDRLVDDQHDAVADRFRLATVLTTIVDTFDDAGIPILPFKGPILAQRLAGDVTARQYGDLDFVVDAADLPRIVGTFEGLGFALERTHSMSFEEIYRGQTVVLPPRELHFYRADDDTHVEVRWLFGSRYRPVDYGFDSLWERSESVDLLGRSIRTLSPEDYVVVLSKHGAKHGWVRLGWVADVARLVEACELDWTAVERVASDAGVMRELRLGCLLVARLTDVSVPAGLVATAGRDRLLPWLAARVERRLVATPTLRCHELPVSEELVFELASSSTIADSVKLLGSVAFRPVEEDHEWRPLPRSFHWLYYLTRPLRIQTGFATGLVGRRTARR